MKRKSSVLVILAALALVSCGKKYTKLPLDVLIRDLHETPAFEIVLHDMDVEGSKYKHQYKIMSTDASGDPTSKITPWVYVPKKYFWSHEKNMGMAIATKKNGKIVKKAYPAGYSTYVGNSRYGYWSGGYWMWNPGYYYMSSYLYMSHMPIYRSYYTGYSSYYGTGRSYYGSGSRRFGTYSSNMRRTRPNFASRTASKSGWSKSASRSYSSSSGSRYGSSSSRSSYSRSSGGGYGK